MEKIKSDIEDFECKKCGECCRGNGVVSITTNEAKNISEFLELLLDDFFSTYTVKIDDSRYFLKDKDNLDCIFLEDSICKVHPVKPQQCIDYPKKWRNKYLINKCPGF